MQNEAGSQDTTSREMKSDAIEAFHKTRRILGLTTPAHSSALNEDGIFGYVGGGNYSRKMGMYKVLQDGGYEYMWTEALQDESFVMLNGWLRDGILCGFTQFGIGSWVLGYAYEELDLSTGEAVSTPRLIDLEDNYMPYYQIATYNPNNDRVYGYGYMESHGDKSVFKSSPGSRPEETEVVKDDTAPEEVCLALCYNDDKGTLAGINLNHEFVYIDLEGNQTSVMELGIEGLQNIVSAMVWSAQDGYYVFNAILEGKKSELYAIDPEEESVTLLSPVSDSLTYAYMVSPYDTPRPDAPSVPEITSVDFPEAESSGSISFILPTTFGSGKPLESTMLGYTVWVDGNVLQQAESTPGETITVMISDQSDGEHVFRVGASSDGKASPKATVRKYIGNDTPKAPANVTMTLDKVSWEAVTEGTHNGWLDLSTMEYEVYLNDEMLGSTSDTYMDVELPEGELTPYSCRVYAICSGKESEASESNTIIYGDPLQLDVEIIPTEEQAQLVTVLDANHDESTWHTRNYQGSLIFSYYPDPVNYGDDWLFLPGIEFDSPEDYYSFTLESSYFTAQDEYFEIWISSTPDLSGERNCILGKTRPESDQFEITMTGFTVPKAGVWYLAIRAVSDPAQSYLNIRNINIRKTDTTADGPQCVTDLAFKDATEDGIFKSEITFRIPENLIDGSAIEAESEITAIVKGTSETEVTGKPGSVQTAIVDVTEGFSKVFVQTVTANGILGAETFIKVYSGPDIPGRVNNLNAVTDDDNMSVTLTWDAPNEGLNGGSINADEISYQLMVFNGKIWTFPSSAQIDNMTCVYTPAENPEILKNYFLGIAAENDMGDNYNDQPTAVAQLGIPHELPIAETFPEAAISVTPLEGFPFNECAGTQWGLADPSLINETYGLDGHVAMTGTASAAGQTGRLIFPKFSTLSSESGIAIELLTWNGDNAAEMTLYAIASGLDKAVEIGKVNKGKGWETTTILLPDNMLGRQWVEIWMDASYASSDDVAMIAEYMISYTTSVSDISLDKTRVYGSDGHITISAPEGRTVEVWTFDGMRTASLITTDSPETIGMARGIYVVRVDGQSFKTIVR